VPAVKRAAPNPRRRNAPRRRANTLRPILRKLNTGIEQAEQELNPPVAGNVERPGEQVAHPAGNGNDAVENAILRLLSPGPGALQGPAERPGEDPNKRKRNDNDGLRNSPVASPHAQVQGGLQHPGEHSNNKPVNEVQEDGPDRGVERPARPEISAVNNDSMPVLDNAITANSQALSAPLPTLAPDAGPAAIPVPSPAPETRSKCNTAADVQASGPHSQTGDDEQTVMDTNPSPHATPGTQPAPSPPSVPDGPNHQATPSPPVVPNPQGTPNAPATPVTGHPYTALRLAFITNTVEFTPRGRNVTVDNRREDLLRTPAPLVRSDLVTHARKH
jgi:hypothetical protein